MATTNAAAYRSSILNHIFGNAALTPPSQVYVGYCTDAVSSGSATECVDATYARKEIHFAASSAGSSRASDGTTSANSTAVTFPAQTAGGNVTGCALFDAASGGNQMTDWKVLTGGTVTLSAGQSFRIPNGSYTLADAWS